MSVDEISEPTDRNLWYMCNPSLGLTLSERQVADEVSLTEDGRIDFNIQRLGHWLKYSQKSVISLSAWNETCMTSVPALKGSISIGIKYSKDGTSVCMAVAVFADEDKVFVEIIGRKPVRMGTDWIVSFLKTAESNILEVVVDGQNGQNILKDAMLDADLAKPVFPQVKEVIEANQRFEDEIYQKTLCHMEQPSLTNVVSNVIHRNIGTSGGFGWKPINDLSDVSLMEAAALALWGRRKFVEVKQEISY